MDSQLILMTPSGQTFTQTVNTSTTLDDVLLYFDVQDAAAYQKAAVQRLDYTRTNFLAYSGTPGREEMGPKTSQGDSVITIQYNVMGLMQPRIVFDNDNEKTYQANQCDFGEVTLGQIYAITTTTGDNNNDDDDHKEGDNVTDNIITAQQLPPIIKATLNHIYTTDHISKHQQQEAIAQVMKSFSTAGKTQHEAIAKGVNTKAPPTQSAEEKRIGEIKEMIELNTMLGDIEAKYSFAKPKITVSARIQQPPSTTPQDASQAAKATQNKQVDDSNDEDDSDSSVPSDQETTDSDDERFYTHNKRDYKVIHRQYVSSREQLKKQIELDRLAGKEPLCTVPNSESDDETKTTLKSTSVTSTTVATTNNKSAPKSLIEMAREMKKQRQLEKTQEQKSQQQQPQEQPQTKPTIPPLGNTFKSKDGKFTAASLTYRFRLPTIFFPLAPLSLTTSTASLKNGNDPVQVPKLVINITFDLEIPSTTTIEQLYEMINGLISESVRSFVSEHMGSSPISGTIQKANSTQTSSTNSNSGSLDRFPFVLSLAGPPNTIFTSQFVTKDTKRFPLGAHTAMRNLNITHRSAFFFHFRHIIPPNTSTSTSPQQTNSTQGHQLKPTQKEALDLVEFITSCGYHPQIPTINSTTLTQEVLVEFLKDIIPWIDSVIIG